MPLCPGKKQSNWKKEQCQASTQNSSSSVIPGKDPAGPSGPSSSPLQALGTHFLLKGYQLKAKLFQV